ncbi:pyridoxal-phosphate dependent enzyme [Sinomonas humi]|uniref:pyridoxal-phosphate dependent enzyme n=1 Tax=Sinomonas humi TaxID=1338436 RepID=UPI00069146D5|nr:pyridoxal-phosphate dependent enzyme [Sinomonas humi]
MLPVEDPNPVSLGEGNTPLVHLQSLGPRLGLDGLYLKNESTNPTWSHKDRLCASAVTAARALGAQTVAAASTGNHGVSLAAYAARAGLRCVISTISSVPDTMKILMEAYGAELQVVEDWNERYQLIADGVRDEGWFACSNSTAVPVGSTPYGVDAYKTIAYELWEQFGGAPIGAVVVPAGYGDCLAGIVRGFEDLRTAGLLEAWPKFIAAEVFGRITQSLKSIEPTTGPYGVSPTAAFSIGGAYTTHQALYALRTSGGTAVSVSEDEILETQASLASLEGFYAEASSCVAVAAAKIACRSGLISSNLPSVVVSTSTGLKDTKATQKWLQQHRENPVVRVGERSDLTV